MDFGSLAAWLAPVLTFVFGYLVKGQLDRRDLNFIVSTITPLTYNLMTEGWTETNQGNVHEHTYRIRLVIQNPGAITRTMIDLIIIWHLNENLYPSENLNPRFVFDPLINVPPNEAVSRVYPIHVPSYYVVTNKDKPFTITYVDEKRKVCEVPYTMNSARRKKPNHVGDFFNGDAYNGAFGIPTFPPDDDDVD